ncbi:MAG: carboxypeptidase-like regulatory domain-containing protein, partial [Armatimonadia bacterium]
MPHNLRRAAAISVLLFAALVSRAATAQPATFTGVVLGPDDQPVPQARVFVIGNHGKPRWAPVEVASDGAGRFSATVPEAAAEEGHSVLAMKDGLALGWGWAKPARATTLHLGGNPVVRSGRVITPSGEPIAGALVVLRSLFYQQPGDFKLLFLGEAGPISCVSDVQGRFSVGSLPPNMSISLQASADGRANTNAQSGTETAGEMVITLPPEATISGRVLSDGQPLGNVSVFCQPQDNSPGGDGYDCQTTAADGSYKLRHLPPGSYNVLIDPPTGLAGKAVEGLHLKAGQEATGTDFSLTPGSLVRGKLIEKNTGKPVADAIVAAYGPARPRSGAACQNTFSRKDGSYELRLPAGRNMIYYQGSGGYGGAGERERWVETTEGQTTEGIDFVLRPPDKVQGVVLSPDGDPAPKAVVSLLGQYGALEVSPDGKFEFIAPRGDGPDQMAPLLLALDKTNGLVAMSPIKLGQKTVALRLQPAAYWSVSVVDTKGAPVAGTCFTVRDEHYAISEGCTDEKGRARLGPLPVGFELHVLLDARSSSLAVGTDRWEESGRFMPRPGEERQLPPLVLNLEGRQLKLCVLDEAQKPVKGALVFVTGRHQSAPTDNDGKLELTGLPMRGKIVVVAVHPTLPLFAAATVDPDWKYWPGLILKPFCQVKGQILDKQGKPVAGANVFFVNG